MNTDQVLKKRNPYFDELLDCFVLVGKIMVSGDADFDETEIAFARNAVDSIEWNQNVRDFLNIIAGSRPHEHDTLYPLCLTALRWEYPINGGES